MKLMSSSSRGSLTVGGLLCLQLGLAGANAEVAAQRPPSVASKKIGAQQTMDAVLDWKMSEKSGQLRIEYTVTNNGKTPLYVVDDMLTLSNSHFVRAPKAIIVRNAEDAQRVSFFRGFLDIPTRGQRVYKAPGLRVVEPGRTLSGTAETPLPLKAWHNYLPDKIEPLKGKPTEAVLELQVLGPLDRSDSESFRPLPLGDGSTIEVPSWLYLNENAKLLRSKPMRIPGS